MDGLRLAFAYRAIESTDSTYKSSRWRTIKALSGLSGRHDLRDHNANDCQLDFDLPTTIVTDNCSRLKSIEAQWQDYNGIWQSTYGTFTTFPGRTPWNRDTLAVLGDARTLALE